MHSCYIPRSGRHKCLQSSGAAKKGDALYSAAVHYTHPPPVSSVPSSAALLTAVTESLAPPRAFALS